MQQSAIFWWQSKKKIPSKNVLITLKKVWQGWLVSHKA